MADSGMRRAAQAKRTRGMAVKGPAARSQAAATGESSTCPCPRRASRIIQARPGAARKRDSMKRPVWASAAICLRTMP